MRSPRSYNIAIPNVASIAAGIRRISTDAALREKLRDLRGYL